MMTIALICSAAGLLVIFAIAIARLSFSVKKLERSREEARSSGDLRHFEYNALISDVSALLEEKSQQLKLKHELSVAKAIQETLLPDHAHHIYGEISVYGKVRMQSACGGDWWFHSRNGDQITLWIGDVTGHGVPSALIASACRAAVGTFAELGISDSEIAMTKLNRILFPMVKLNMLVSAICVTFDCATGKAKIVNASHPNTIFIGRDGEAVALREANNPLLGFTEGHEYMGVELQLKDKELLVLLTDGVLDFPHVAKPMWSEKRLRSFFTSAAKRELKLVPIMMQLEDKLQSPDEQEDDITYVAIQRNSLAA